MRDQPSRTPHGFARLTLQTRKLDELRTFYREQFGMPVLADGANSVTLKAGDTALTFEQTSDETIEPFFHFAFNIPENKLVSAKTWLSRRAKILSHHGHDEYDFRDWNAHAVYFWDPAGNLGELIARHDLANANAGDFRGSDLLNVSEIGIVVDDVPTEAKSLKAALGVETYKGSASQSFEAIGDAHQLLIVVPVGRGWFPTGEKHAAAFPTMAEMRGPATRTRAVAGKPYRVSIGNSKDA